MKLDKVEDVTLVCGMQYCIPVKALVVRATALKTYLAITMVRFDWCECRLWKLNPALLDQRAVDVAT